MSCVNASDVSSIEIDAATLEMLVTSNVTGFEGLKYGADYSANFVLRSLVDLGYVKGFIWQANAAPTATDDSNDEFEVGTLWVDRSVSPAKLYVCTNATVGAAVWQSIIPNITSGTAPPSGGNDGDIYLQYT